MSDVYRMTDAQMMKIDPLCVASMSCYDDLLAALFRVEFNTRLLDHPWDVTPQMLIGMADVERAAAAFSDAVRAQCDFTRRCYEEGIK